MMTDIINDHKNPIRIGQRASVGAHYGVVRYIGPIPDTDSAVWVGVEWDDSTRGKHNGVHNGVRYFNTL